MNGLVEQFIGTLKQMLHKVVMDNPKQWPKWMPYILFAVREVPQASAGFSPFELIFGQKPREVLDLLKERWEDPAPYHKQPVQMVLELRATATDVPVGTGGIRASIETIEEKI